MTDPYDDFEVVYTYTIKDMLEDGMLFDLHSPNVGSIPIYAPVFSGIRYITSALLDSGYIDGDKLNLPNLADLLVQVSKGIKKGMAQGEDRLFESMVEFPDGHREKVWAVVNEEGTLTLMLPSDY
ncbi:hypothetical protein KKD40_01350 [Candidatus Micrarchaeota archaeon]|nr:hypothetical protein [Candidatus Micrarchaeota archaeon]